MNNLKASIMEDVLNKLNNYIDEDIELEDNALDVSFSLWQTENANQTITFNKYEAIEWIKNNFEDLDEVVEDYCDNFREMLNPFDDPEKFMVIIHIEVTNDLISEVWEDDMNTKQLMDALKEYQTEKGWDKIIFS